MDTNARIAPVDAVQPATARPPTPVDQPVPKALSEIEAASRYRLLIEEGPRKGSFVYKTLDSTTGEVIRQFPREQLVRLAETDTYAQGTVINTSA